MTDSTPIPATMAALAADHGIVADYVDGTGTRRVASTDVLLAVLASLGSPVTHPREAAAALRRRRRERVARMVEPVTVLDETTRGDIEVWLRAADTSLECALETEDGERVEWTIARDRLMGLVTETLDGRDVHVGRIPLPGILRPGYHTFTVRARGRTGSATVIVPPAIGARGRFADDWRAFGIVAPLFSLHSRRSWGSGDLGDLDDLAQFAASEQASVVATLPLLAGFGPESFEASPYLPVSRYVLARTVDRPGTGPRAGMVGLGAIARVSATRAKADSTRFVCDSIVDGPAALAAKRAVLERPRDRSREVGAGP